jgi:hypothetical protein
MMEVMGTIIQGGFTKVSLLTEQIGDGSARAPAPVPAMTVPPAPAAAPATPAPTPAAGPRRQGRG